MPAVRAPLTALIVMLGACSGTIRAPEVRFVDAFATTGAEAAAAYLVLDNTGGEDELVAVELRGTDAGLARTVSMHTTTDRDGISVMERADTIEVRADGRTELAPGGTHLMLEGLRRPIEPGQRLQIRLLLARGGPLDAEVEVIAVEDALDRAERRTAR